MSDTVNNAPIASNIAAPLVLAPEADPLEAVAQRIQARANNAPQQTTNAPIVLAPENDPITEVANRLSARATAQAQAIRSTGDNTPPQAPDLSRNRVQSAPINNQAPQQDAINHPQPKPPVTGKLPQSQAMRDYFEKTARDHNMPVNVLMAFADQESGYNPRALNADTNAAGMLQYTPDTARARGINPFDWRASVKQAADDYSRRVASGLTPQQAIMAHFGGDNQNQWGKKTQAYGQDVLKRSADIFSHYQKEHTDTLGDEVIGQHTDTNQLDSAASGVNNTSPVSNPTYGGDLSRGFGSAFSQLKGTAEGTAGLVGDFMQRTTGIGTGLRDWGYRGFKASEKQDEANSQPSDSFTTMLGQVGSGDYSALGHFLFHGTGYVSGQAVQGLAAALGGAAVGSVVPGAGTAGGAIAATVEKTAARRIFGKLINNRLAALEEAAAKKGVENGLTEAAAAAEARAIARKQLNTQLFGAAAGPFGLNLTQEAGTIYGSARDQAADDANQPLNRPATTELAERNIQNQAFPAPQTPGLSSAIRSDTPINALQSQIANGADYSGLAPGMASQNVAGSFQRSQAPSDNETILAARNIRPDQNPNGNLTNGQLARVAAVSPLSAGVDTIANATLFARFMNGAHSPASGLTGYARAIARAVGKDMTTEGTTELVQTALERFGANQSITDSDAMRDYIDSAVLGAMGGGYAGIATGIKESIPSKSTQNAPPSPTGTPPSPTGAPPSPTGTPPSPTGTPPSPTGAPPSPTGTPPSPTGTPPSPTGAPPSPTGAPPSPTGAPPSPTGAPPSPTGGKTVVVPVPGAPQATPNPLPADAGPVQRATAGATHAANTSAFSQAMADDQAPEVMVSGGAQDLHGILNTFQQLDNGGWRAEVLDGDGQNHILTDRDGVTITPVSTVEAPSSDTGRENPPHGGDVPASEITAEPQSDIQAQINAIRDGGTQKNAVLIPPSSQRDTDEFADLYNQPTDIGSVTHRNGLYAVNTAQGLFVSSDERKAEAAASNSENLSTQDVGTLLGYGTPKAETDGTVIQGRDNQGNIVHQEATNVASAPDALARAKAHTPDNGSVETTNAQAVQHERNARIFAERYKPEEMDRSEIEGELEYLDHLAKLAKGWPAPIMRRREALESRLDALDRDGHRDDVSRPVSPVTESDIELPHNAFDKSSEAVRKTIHEARKIADDSGLTQQVWSMALRGLSIDQIARDGTDAAFKVFDDHTRAAGDKLADGRRDAVYAVQSSLGIPPQSDASAFKAWQDKNQKQNASPTEEKSKTAPSTEGKWFGTQAKADAWLSKNGLSESHKAVQDGRRFNIVERPSEQIEQASVSAATSPDNSKPEPTEAQKEAGNYAKGHATISGLGISIENAAGTRRNPAWPILKYAYGYIKGTVGHDKDHVDVFLGPKAEDLNNPVYVVNQRNTGGGKFDEHKVMMGFASIQAARKAYLSNYTPNWDGLQNIVAMTFPQFKAWALSDEPKKGPITRAGVRAAAEGSSTEGISAPEKVSSTPAEPAESKAEAPTPNVKPLFKKAKAGKGATAFVFDPSGWSVEPAPKVTKEEAAKKAPDVSGWDASAKNDTAPPEPDFSRNKIFTEDKYLAAKKRLQQKFGNLNSGFDPELMLDVFTVAGAHIERGVKRFAPYAEAMIRDFGDHVKPFLLAAYNSVRDYPGIDVSEMDNSEQARTAFDAMIQPPRATTADIESSDPSVGTITKRPAGAKASKNPKAPGPNYTLPDSYGVDHIDGFTPTPGVKPIDTDNGLKNGVKAQSLKDAKRYLTEVSSALSNQGFAAKVEKHTNKYGVSVNEGGPAVSGDATLNMTHPQTGMGVQMMVGASALGGFTPTTKSGVNVVWRVVDTNGKLLNNNWAPVDLSAADIANDINTRFTRQAQNNTGTNSHGANQPVSSPVDTGARDSDTTASPVSAPNADRPTLDNARPANGGGVTDVRNQLGSDDNSGIANGEQSPLGKPSGKRVIHEAEGVRGDASSTKPSSERDTVSADTRAIEQSNGKPVSDYRYTAGELTRDVGWKSVAERNVQAVEIIRKLEAEDRLATPQERALLARYTGWGASELANGMFDVPGKSIKQGWEELSKRLKAAMTPSEYKTASQSTRHAHYTSEQVIRSIYKGLTRLGFAGGRVIEPGMGIGLFRGLMPNGIQQNSKYVGIEFDGITAAIARQLYPNSTVRHADYTRTKLPKNFFDVAIGNPPFASDRVTNDPEYRKEAFLLHDYFFAKTIDRVRPGGLLVFVTSKGTMDKGSDRARTYLAERANLLGAIRLPNSAFKENAGTEVVTDVLFLQKRGPGVPEGGESWLGTAPITVSGSKFNINEYYVAHPEMVLGEHSATGSMYRANEYTVTPHATDIEADFAKAIDNLPKAVFRPEIGSRADVAAVQSQDFNPVAEKEGGLYIGDDGKVWQRVDGVGKPLTMRINKQGKEIALTKRQLEFLSGYVGLRDAIKATQWDQLNSGPWESSLEALKNTYSQFVLEHGNILDHTVVDKKDSEGRDNSYTIYKNATILRLDPENSLVRALEKINPDGTISTTSLLSERVISPPAAPKINSVEDALLVSLNNNGKLLMSDVARLAGLTKDEAIEQLGEKLYQNPSGEWDMADAYLSGNVVAKLAEAREAAEINPAFRRNVTALEAVQPTPLSHRDISVSPGVGWIPARDMAIFASDVLGHNLKVTYNPVMKIWTVLGNPVPGSPYGIERLGAPAIFDAVLNNKSIRLTNTMQGEGGKKITVPDIEMTEAANAIATKMRKDFRAWVWQDAERRDRLVSYYNDNFNNIVPRTFDGRHLTLPGTSDLIKFHPHQKRAIWRGLQQGNVYYAHAVGAGKTYEMIATGMESKRLGLISQPLYAVPNHMLQQFAREFQELYPTAHLMVADENDFHQSQRQEFVARAALNKPDAIIITHSAFEKIPMSDEYQDAYTAAEVGRYKDMLEEMKGEKDSPSFKQVQAAIKRIEDRIEKRAKRDTKDNNITFEQMGVDYLLVDEFHKYRKLSFATNRGDVKGIDPNGSNRAQDMHMKVEYLDKKKPGRALCAASGTPVTNTIGEMFTLQRFMEPQRLEEDGLDSFDAWASHFGEIVEGLEANAAGSYNVVSRFARFVNVPDLMARVLSFMDVLTSEQLGSLVTRPDVQGGGRQIIVTPTPNGYPEFQKQLQSRIEAIKNRSGPAKKGQDIMLNVIGDGRLAAIDMRFIDPSLPSDPNSKINQTLKRIAEKYHETADHEYITAGQIDQLKGSSILLFSNLGLGEQSAKTRGFNLKEWTQNELIRLGVEHSHIAFMSDYTSPSKKEKLFADMREGKKRILIGGENMEVGTNVQKRLAYLGHLDAPWFPASVEQREGRIIRQGNQNKEVTIEAFATKGSYDSTMWGGVARKQRFITQAFQGDKSTRSMEDVSEASSFEMASALSSGDQRYIQLAGLRSDVERLSRLQSAHDRDQRLSRGKVLSLRSAADRANTRAETLKSYLAKRQPIGKGDDFRAKIMGKEVTTREQFNESVLATFQKLASQGVEDSRSIGSFAGFDVMFDGMRARGSGEYYAAVSLGLPNIDPLIEFPIHEDFKPAGIIMRATNQVGAIEGQIKKAEDNKADSLAEARLLERRGAADFPEQSELDEKLEQLNALEAELAEDQQENDDAQNEAAALDQNGDVSVSDNDAPPMPDTAASDLHLSIRVKHLDEIRKLNEARVSGKITEDQFGEDMERLLERAYNNHTETSEARKDKQVSDRVRGPDWIRERIYRGMRNGDITREGGELALWALDRNPNLAEDLGISISQKTDNPMVAGFYNAATRIVHLVGIERDTQTLIHEIMHHAERMMPSKIQQRIIAEWAKSWAKAYNNQKDEKVKAALLDMQKAALGDAKAKSRVMLAFKKGILKGDGHYALFNPSEFWAVNASRIIQSRAESRTWLQAAKNWMREFIQKLKGIIGLSSDSPVIAGLKSIMRGEGDFVSPRMLSEAFRANDANDDSATYNNIRTEPEDTGERDSVPDIAKIYPRNPDTIKTKISNGSLGPAAQSLFVSGRIRLEGKTPANAPIGADAWTDSQGVIHLLTNLDPAIAEAKLLHEVFHAGVAPLVGSKAWNALLVGLEGIYKRAKASTGGMNTFWNQANSRLQSAVLDGDTNTLPDNNLSVQEFGAYAIEQYTQAPKGIQSWADRALGAVKAWALTKFGKQLGEITPAQLHALAVSALNAGAATDRALNYANMTDRTMYSARDREQIIEDATKEITERKQRKAEEANPDADGENDVPFFARVPFDLDIYNRLLGTPRHIASIYRPFAPVFQAVLDRFARRDRIINDLNTDYEHYAALTKEGKEKVNQMLELGRHVGRTFERAELEDGVKNLGFRYLASLGPNGRMTRVKKEFKTSLSKTGDTIKLTTQEAEAYSHVRVMLDRALDKMRDSMLRDLGYDDYGERPEELNALIADLKKSKPSHAEGNLLRAAQVIEDFEQAKRTGYVPFSRFGQYVIAVKKDRADLKVTRQGGTYFVQNMPDELSDMAERMGAQWDDEHGGYALTQAQYKAVRDANTDTIYSEKVEVSKADYFKIRRAGARGFSAMTIPSVRKAYERIQKEWAAPGSGARMVEPFAVDMKRPEQKMDIKDIQAIADVAQITGPEWEAISKKLSDAIQSMSFRRHFFNSDNVPGYSTDFERAITDYMVGTAGYLARRDFQNKVDTALNNIGKETRLYNYARDYVKYTDEPQEEFALLRQAGFGMYIAGNIASGITNLTQLPIMTYPALKQFASHARVIGEMSRAFLDAIKMVSFSRDIGLNAFDPHKAPQDVKGDFMKDWNEGEFVPTATFEVMATANQRNQGSRVMRRKFERGLQMVGLTFSVFERINRIATYIATIRMAKDPLIAKRMQQVYKKNQLAMQQFGGANFNPSRVANFMVDETQFRMGKANRGAITRGAMLPIFQFKSFLQMSLETYYRMMTQQGPEGRAGAVLSLAIMVGMSGIWGFPGGDDLRKVLEAFLSKVMRHDVDMKSSVRDMVYDATHSPLLASVVTRGAPMAVGLDMSRVGMGTVFPDDSDVMSLLGIPADLASRFLYKMPGQLYDGNPWGALQTISPKFLSNLEQAYQMRSQGYMDAKGRMIATPEQLSVADAMQKAFGFQPPSISNLRDYNYAEYRMQHAVDARKTEFTMRAGSILARIGKAQTPEERAALSKQLSGVFDEINEYNKGVSPERQVNISRTAIKNAAYKQQTGLAGAFGREARSARQAASGLRTAFGVQDDEGNNQ